MDINYPVNPENVPGRSEAVDNFINFTPSERLDCFYFLF